MFGSNQGPWNHSFRLEHKLGPRLKVRALIDPDAVRAKDALQKKCESFVEPAYKDTVVYPTIDAYHAAIKESGEVEPRYVYASDCG